MYNVNGDEVDDDVMIMFDQQDLKDKNKISANESRSPVDLSYHSGKTFPSMPAHLRTVKKVSNPWGNLSYADIITLAILDSRDLRCLTLNQIYMWFVRNIPYFRDREFDTSNCTWKNAIRHTLSLHDQFKRVPYFDGTNRYLSLWTVETGRNAVDILGAAKPACEEIAPVLRNGKVFWPDSLGDTTSIEKDDETTATFLIVDPLKVEEPSTAPAKPGLSARDMCQLLEDVQRAYEKQNKQRLLNLKRESVIKRVTASTVVNYASDVLEMTSCSSAGSICVTKEDTPLYHNSGDRKYCYGTPTNSFLLPLHPAVQEVYTSATDEVIVVDCKLNSCAETVDLKPPTTIAEHGTSSDCSTIIPHQDSMPVISNLRSRADERPFVSELHCRISRKDARNPWGKLTYSDLIAQAILSSPKQRLTLQGIYDWFTENIDYIRRLPKANSGIRWKSTIRHKLSLDKCFVSKVFNGKSNWTVDFTSVQKKMTAKNKGESRRTRTVRYCPIGSIPIEKHSEGPAIDL